MPPSIALLLWIILLVGLIWFDPAKVPQTSVALWVPVTWMFIEGSRLPSQWLGDQVGQAAQALEEGNPFDRTIYFGLLFLAIGILISRSFKWGDFFARNRALVALVSFALVSVCWSDFPFVAFKRWFRDLGNYLVVLVVLSDPRPSEAVRAVLRRLGYLLLPLSVVLVRYYPQIGKQYSASGVSMYAGVTTGKNLLGIVCVICGLFFFWDTLTRWSERKQKRTSRIILLNLAFIAMTLYLLHLAQTATANVCLILGCLVIVAARTRSLRRHPAFLKMLIPASFCLYLILAFGFNMSGELAGAVGKDPTLTDRTRIWTFVLSMHTNPFFGTGYESFWLGPRLQWFWQMSGLGRINEAHNGYLEVYLNLGIIGLLLVAAFLIASYRTIWNKLSPLASLSSLTLALWIIFLFYNVTEAGFRSGLMWLTFLLSSIAFQQKATARQPRTALAGPERVTGASVWATDPAVPCVRQD